MLAFLRAAEYLGTVLDDELNGFIFGVHIGHFTFEAGISHNRGCEYNGKILWCHLKDISTGH